MKDGDGGDDDECGSVGRMRIGRGIRSTRRKPTAVPLCPPQTPNDDLGSNPGRRGGKPSTNRLSYCTAIRYFKSRVLFELAIFRIQTGRLMLVFLNCQMNKLGIRCSDYICCPSELLNSGSPDGGWFGFTRFLEDNLAGRRRQAASLFRSVTHCNNNLQIFRSSLIRLLLLKIQIVHVMAS
jgi:hypothetical protein